MEASLAKVPAFLLLPLLTACSLDYAQDQATTASAPEFTLRAASFFRYEDNEVSFSLDSPRIEQYASPPVTFVEDASFIAYSGTGEPDAEGTCGLLAISQVEGQDGSELTFYGGVRLERLGDGTILEGTALRWNTVSGAVASPSEELTTLTRGAMTLEGFGFCAREEGSEFSFASGVSGFIVPEAEEGER